MNTLRKFDIQYIKGIGPKRAEIISKHLEAASAYDLIRHFPLHYLDRTNIYRIADFAGEMPTVQVRGRFLNFQVAGEGAKRRLVGTFSDGTGILEVVWFNNIQRLREHYKTGNEYIVFGKPTYYGRSGRWSMSHPEIDPPSAPGAAVGLRGVYSIPDPLRKRGITSRTISSWMRTILDSHPTLVDPLPSRVIERLGLMSIRDALVNVHFPTSPELLERARFRLKFEELFFIQVDMQRTARHRKAHRVASGLSTWAVFLTVSTTSVCLLS